MNQVKADKLRHSDVEGRGRELSVLPRPLNRKKKDLESEEYEIRQDLLLKAQRKDRLR